MAISLLRVSMIAGVTSVLPLPTRGPAAFQARSSSREIAADVLDLGLSADFWWKDFGPHLSFAYSKDTKTVIRGAYARSYGALGLGQRFHSQLWIHSDPNR